MSNTERGARAHVAIDLGAGGGRALLGWITSAGFEFELIQRFSYAPRLQAGHERWDFAALMRGVRASLGLAGERARSAGFEIASVGVDGWGVDYGWLDERGTLLADPVGYRDARTAGALEKLLELVPRAEIYERTGIQLLPINTLVQLLAEQRALERPARARHLLLVPDLVHREMCGSLKSETTNASTTQLLDARTRRWDARLLECVGVSPTMMPELVVPGSDLGALDATFGILGARVIAPATHDTASAVLGAPLESNWAFISSGTWSLVGVERATPVLSEEACAANFTNEAGVAGTTRLLKNVMGLWILERCRVVWEREGRSLAHARIATELAGAQPDARCIDPDDLRFLDPPDMAAEVRASLRESGQRAASEPLEIAQIVLQSLALRYAEVLRTLERLCGAPLCGVHVVGGGSRNDVLNQMTANASGMSLRAGPEEATALGNLLAQMLASGEITDLAAARQLVAQTLPPRSFEPHPSEAWARAAEQLRTIARRG